MHIQGNDITQPFPVGAIQKCETACNWAMGCVAYLFDGVTGWCWMKTALASPAAANYTTGVLMSQGESTWCLQVLILVRQPGAGVDRPHS